MRIPVLSLLILLASGVAAAAEPAPAGATPIDLARYAGTWHEIARKPHFFQRNCARETTATYTPADGYVKVVNRCLQADGSPMSVDGKAFVTDAPLNRKLKVGFFELFGWMPFKGDYWILDIDPAYRWVIVGGPDREYAWILARTPTLDPATRGYIDARLKAHGYDPKSLSAGAAPGQ